MSSALRLGSRSNASSGSSSGWVKRARMPQNSNVVSDADEVSLVVGELPVRSKDGLRGDRRFLRA